MRLLVVFVASTIALVASIGLLIWTAPAGGAAGPARVQVTALEFEYRLSRLRVPEGNVRVELANFGQDEHDLAFRRVGGTRVFGLPKTLPGARRTTTLRLRPGRYRLWCRMGDHAARGMYADLRVTKRR
jgi:Cupredoxin-like domain